MKQGLIVGVSVLVMGLGIVALAWWFWPRDDDQRIAKIKQLQQQVFQQQASSSEAQRRQLFRQLRDEMEQLPPQERAQLRGEMFAGARERMTTQIKAFAELPPENRMAFLDEQIDRMESRRQARQGVRAQSEANVPRRSRRGGPFSAPGGDPRMSQEERDQRRRERLDGSTARERAQFSLYFEALRKRRQERGLPLLGRLSR
jgi:hypothetical protein